MMPKYCITHYYSENIAKHKPFTPENRNFLKAIYPKKSRKRFQIEINIHTCITAIGKKFAPPYAILFMPDLEEKIISAFEEKPMIWWR